MFQLAGTGRRLSFRDMGDALRKKLTPSNIKTLTAGKTTRKYVFREESGRKFKAKIKLAKGGRGLWEPVMIEREPY